MKILITGSNGFIGSHLRNSLSKDGITIIGFDQSCEHEQTSSYECIIGDIREKEKLLKALNSVDAVIHLIAMHHDFGIKESVYFDINELGTKTLLDCCSAAGVKKFIFYSSVAIYGSQPKPTDETTTPNPELPYGRSKLAAEKVIEQWAKEDPTRQVIIIRPTVIFGPKNYANVYNLINQVYHRRFIFVGDGSNIKSVAYVENLVEATRFLLYRMKSRVDIYNYVDEKQMTTKQIVEIISRLLSVPIPKIEIPLWLAIGFGSIFDLLGKITGYNFLITGKRIKKFCTETHHNADKIRASGFRQPVSLDEGFKRTIAWYLEISSKAQKKST